MYLNVDTDIMILYDDVDFEISFSNSYCFFLLFDKIMNKKQYKYWFIACQKCFENRWIESSVKINQNTVEQI